MKHKDEHAAYKADIEQFDRLYRDGTTPGALLQGLMQASKRFVNPEYKAHFLYMVCEVLSDIGETEAAYETLLKTERLFNGTLFARVAGDRSKILFMEQGGRFLVAPGFVPSVQIEPTNHCNLNCIMCGRNKARAMGYMEFDLFKALVDQALAAGAYGIRLYHMGEPLLHPQIVDFIAYFKGQVQRCGFEDPCLARQIGIMTNSTLLDEKLAESLIAAGIDVIGFSIDGRNAAEYEKIRRGGRYEQVVANLEQTRRIRDRKRHTTQIRVAVLDMALDEQDRLRLDHYYTQKGADEVSFLPCSPFAGRQVINEKGELVAVKENATETKPPACAAENVRIAPNLLDRIGVLWNGDIQTSCGEPTNGNVIGNIREISLIEAYGIKMRKLGLVV